MDSFIPFSTSNEFSFKYFFDYNNSTFYLAHPFIIDFLMNKTFHNNNEISNYYYKKFEFIKSKNSPKKIQSSDQIKGKIDKNLVFNLLNNLNHIVFEVTNSCNLRCKYCAYGEFYETNACEKNENMSLDMIESFLNYISQFLRNSFGNLYIGFYGGEPLLNIQLIKQTVSLIKKKYNNRNLIFSITTNGVLLNKYIDYLVENNFQILVSIDGNEYNNSYRVDKNGNNSFKKIFQNLKNIEKIYPVFFNKNINFNTVLHNRNSINESHTYLLKEFNKTTQLSELNNNGIKPDKIVEFNELYYDVFKQVKNVKNYKEFISEQFIGDPNVFQLALFITTLIKNTSYFSYNDLFEKTMKKTLPTGTCAPFQKKIFITVDGKILPCERINQKYTLGNIVDNKVQINIDKIVETYNNYYSIVKKNCDSCYQANSCLYCFFQTDINAENFQCPSFTDFSLFSKKLSDIVGFLEENPNLFNQILKDVIFK